jgi:TFIIH basal transcription factor complex TTD-A subunit
LVLLTVVTIPKQILMNTIESFIVSLYLLFVCSDIPMTQFIVNMNNSMPPSQKFIIHVLDSTHLFVQPHVEQMIRSAISDFRDQNSYEKPTS